MPLSPQEIIHLSLMQSLEKNASVEPVIDLSPTPHTASFDENILALSTQLRANGLSKYADNLESKFASFKKADIHLYRVHDEDGEDLVEFAHPDGDHNVEDGDLGDVETIVSRHNKLTDIVNKSPTGKLASYVDACKIVLAAPNALKQELIRASNLVNKATVYIMGKTDLGDNWKAWTRNQATKISNLSKEVPSDDSLDEMSHIIDTMEDQLEPSKLRRLFNPTSEISDPLWKSIEELFKEAKRHMATAKNELRKTQSIDVSKDIEEENTPEEPDETQEPQIEGASWEAPATKTRQPISFTRGPDAQNPTAKTISLLEGWKTQMARAEDPEDAQAGSKWIDATIAKLQSQPDPATLANINKQIAQFKQTWKMR